MADYYDDWEVQEPRYRRRSPGQGRKRRKGRRGPAGGGYNYARQHGGQWEGFEPERRDYGTGYRPAYTYEENEPDLYQAGYDYGEEHGGQWEGFEPARRDYGRFRGRRFRRNLNQYGEQFPFEEEAYESGRRQRRRRGRRRRQQYEEASGTEYPFPGDRPEDRPSVYNREHPYTYNAERPPYYAYPTYQAGAEPGPHTGKGPEGYHRSDEAMFEDACEAMTEHGYLDASAIEVSVDDGEVILEGNVESRWAKRLAEDLAASVRGVWDVHNRLHIPRESSGGEETEDQT